MAKPQNNITVFNIDVTPLPQVENDFFYNRMQPLGVTENTPNNFILIDKGNGAVFPERIFTRCTAGIRILVYTLNSKLISYKEDTTIKVDDRGHDVDTVKSRWAKNYSIVRFEHPKVKADGSIQKYSLPANQIVQPFFPPALIEKYKSKTPGETLYLTEGYIKAYYSSLCGLDCVGIPSITTLKNKETGKIHNDILQLILACNYKRVVWLVDGDCRNITAKEIANGVNLTKRPETFFNTVSTFHDLLSKIDTVQLYFSLINTYNLKNQPKGLDDLLLEYKDQQQEIVKQFNDFSTIKQSHTYFERFSISVGVGNIRRYFYLHNVDEFYFYHAEVRPELKNKEFRFFGTLYKYDEDKKTCLVRKHGEAKNYIRVGDTYFEKLTVPDHLGYYYEVLEQRDKTTITDDYGKEFIKQINKYKGFVNIPNNINYQPVIDNFYNKYCPINIELIEGDYTQSIDFLKHIFGTDKIQVTPTQQIERWEMGLDYLTIMWRYPWQILPILSLVSEERQTGKTKFIEWLCFLFGENGVIIGNQDLENKFNRHWNGKLIIAVDETKIERLIVMERIKALSTSSFIIDEGKGRDQKKAGFFGKFILNSNNVKNFASIEEKEIRFWVNEVPVVEKRNTELLADLKEEAGAFLSYISKRQIICPKVERHWFETRILKTDALKRVVEHSKPTINKIFTLAVIELFNATEDEVIRMPLDAVVKELLKGKYERNYVKDTLHEMGYKTKPSGRSKFPRLIEKMINGALEITPEYIGFHTTYYEFEKQNFNTGLNHDTDFSY